MEPHIRDMGGWTKRNPKANDKEFLIDEEFLSHPSSGERAENWIVYKSVINMLGFYRTELLGLLRGKNIVDLIPLGTRKRLIEHGVLRKFGTQFELTDRGRTILIK
jgi:hypothetical protein